MERSEIIAGTSEAAKLVRTVDWSQTVLGALSHWPDVLVATVNTVLASPVPTQLFWGPDLICIYNDAVTSALSTKHPHAMGKPAREVWREAWHTVGPQLEGVLATGQPLLMTDFLIPVLREGVLQDHYWTYSYSPVYGPQTKIVGLVNTSQDVTAAVLGRHAEKARRESEDRFGAFLLATNHALFQMNADWSVMYRLQGKRFLQDTETEDRNWIPKYVLPPDQELVQEAIRRAIETKSTVELEHRVFRVDGTVGWTSSRAIPILEEESGEVRSWFGAATDITDRKLMEAALIQQEKLAAVGQLASTIAHEINNPLEAVTNLLFLARTHAVLPDVQKWLDQADAELRRVGAITSQTLRFHRQSTKPQPVTCTSLFSSTLDLYEARLRNSNIAVEKRKRAEEPVLCFEGDVRQVLSNLVANAIDAMPQGGRLLVRSREGTEWPTGRKGLVLTVADSGSGMSPETRTRALDAFYTTKGIGGSGLGLWISAQIMERHRGRIALRSRQGEVCHGTVITLFLPFDGTA